MCHGRKYKSVVSAYPDRKTRKVYVVNFTRYRNRYCDSCRVSNVQIGVNKSRLLPLNHRYLKKALYYAFENTCTSHISSDAIDKQLVQYKLSSGTRTWMYLKKIFIWREKNKRSAQGGH